MLQSMGSQRVGHDWETEQQQQHSYCVLTWQRAKRKQAISYIFTRALISIMRDPPLWSDHLPRAPSSNTITLGVRVSSYECEEGRMWNTNFQSTAFTYSIHLGLITFIILKKKNKIMGSGHITANRRGKSGSCDRFYFWGALKSLQMVIAAMKLKDTCSLEGKLWQT